MRQTGPSGDRTIPTVLRRFAVLTLSPVVFWVAFASEEPRTTVHRDGRATEEASLAMSRALILEDLAAAGKALEALGEASPPLKPEDRETVGKAIYNADRSFQETLIRTREYVAKGDVIEALNEYVWVQRTCLNCHRIAREEGRLPATGPIRPARP
jgi:hypothetical protein